MMKARLTGAQKGHSLLKKKADALQMRFRSILNKIVEVGCNTPNEVLCSECELFHMFYI